MGLRSLVAGATVVGMVIISGCGDTAGTRSAPSAPPSSAPTPDRSATSITPAAEGDELFMALGSSGVDLGSAPASVKRLDGAAWCGMEQRQQDVVAETVLDEAARWCFLDRHRAGQAAVFVEEFPTIEGDPIVTVWRTSDGGSLEVHVDSSRDTYGAGGWSRQICRSLTTTFPDRPEPVPASFFACSTDDPPTPRRGGVDGPVVFGQEPLDPNTPVEEAIAAGTLVLVDACLVAESAVGDGSAMQQTLIVWKFGTTWDPATSSVVLDDGARIAIGDEFEIGGGYHPLGALNRYVGDLDAEARIRDCSQVLDTSALFIQSPQYR
ncbi:MAG: hypothetical protein ACSLE8_25460 [Rhodococcus sp. (in: high G+C Gram-positive bacteria)]